MHSLSSRLRRSKKAGKMPVSPAAATSAPLCIVTSPLLPTDNGDGSTTHSISSAAANTTATTQQQHTTSPASAHTRTSHNSPTASATHAGLASAASSPLSASPAPPPTAAPSCATPTRSNTPSAKVTPNSAAAGHLPPPPLSINTASALAAAAAAAAAAAISPASRTPASASARSPAAPTPPASASAAASSHGAHHTTPRSPFHSLAAHFTRHSNKRQRSPTPASLPVQHPPAVASPDGLVEPGLSTPPPAHNVKDTAAVPVMADPGAPTIPPFLAQSHTDISDKFERLQDAERFRLAQGATNPSPDFQWAKLGMAPSDSKALDRYFNIQPWANNRVHLQVPDGHLDYINASPVVLSAPAEPADPDRPDLRYIAMQGPKAGTTDHAWRMVAEQLQSPAVVVMLTETHESGMEKCYPYFPRTPDDEPLQIGQDDEFGDGFVARLTCDEVQDKADGAIQVRKLTLRVEGRDEDMTVWHLLYCRWPDFGVPALQDIDSFFELMQLSRHLNASQDNPRIVHCSAGVGRSGTFIALEHLMREVDSGAFEAPGAGAHADREDPVYQTVNTLRQQRRMMVQAEAQFVFIYQVLRKRYMDKYGIAEDVTPEEPAAKRFEDSSNDLASARAQLRGAQWISEETEDGLIDLGE